MPDGLTHFRYWKSLGIPIALVTFVILVAIALGFIRNANSAYIFEYAIWFGLWYFVTAIIDPDLDQVILTKADSRAIKHLGILGDFFFAYWSLYAALMNRIARRFHIKGVFGAHRSWLTHSIFPGTIIRMFFIDWVIVLFLYFIQFRFGIYDWIVFFTAQFHALCLGDIIHIILDKVYGGP